jgi:aminopeptidase
MADPRLEKLAKTMVEYSVKVKKGDWVVISSHVLGEPLAAEIYRQALRAGGFVNILMHSDPFVEILYAEANDEQLKHITAYDRIPLGEADVFIAVNAAHNTRSLANANPARMQLRQASRKDIVETYFKRSASGELRWTMTNFPCAAYAQDADMSVSDYEDFVFKATFSDQPDPIKAWKELEANQQRLVDWLAGKKKVELRSPNIDASLSIEGRVFKNSTATNNMPSGEIFTSPVEDSMNGWVNYTYPAVIYGRETDGVHLEFKDGRVVKASAQKNEEFLISTLDTDANARVLGELGIGTNFGIDRFTKNILYDEKIGGTIHLAVGAGFPEVGGTNKSTVHWDMLVDMRKDSEIKVDGTVFYKNGEFQV